jgi:hypothetical protein
MIHQTCGKSLLEGFGCAIIIINSVILKAIAGIAMKYMSLFWKHASLHYFIMMTHQLYNTSIKRQQYIASMMIDVIKVPGADTIVAETFI